MTLKLIKLNPIFKKNQETIQSRYRSNMVTLDAYLGIVINIVEFE